MLLVERSACHFVDKVRHAQQAAAAGVVVFNAQSDDDSGALSAMADDGSAGDIRVPSLLIRRRDALALIDLMRTARRVVVADDSLRAVLGRVGRPRVELQCRYHDYY